MKNLKNLKDEIEDLSINSNNIFITPHKNADFDAIASAIGMYLIETKLNKPAYIIFDELPSKVEPGVKSIIEETNTNIKYINIDTFNKLKTDNDLLICVDVSKKNMLYSTDLLNCKNIIIIDHHHRDDNTISTEHDFITKDTSSISEIVSLLLSIYKIKYSKEVANYLLAGIYLDTNKFQKNCSHITMEQVSKLMNKGADLKKVNSFFEEDFLSDRKVQDLVSKANFMAYTIALSIGDDKTIYTKEELAKVADYLLKFRADASLAVGLIDDELISISARSKGNIDVGKLMTYLGGGGNIYSAATKIESNNIEEVGKKVLKLVNPEFYLS